MEYFDVSTEGMVQVHLVLSEDFAAGREETSSPGLHICPHVPSRLLGQRLVRLHSARHLCPVDLGAPLSGCFGPKQLQSPELSTLACRRHHFPQRAEEGPVVLVLGAPTTVQPAESAAA